MTSLLMRHSSGKAGRALGQHGMEPGANVRIGSLEKFLIRLCELPKVRYYHWAVTES